MFNKNKTSTFVYFRYHISYYGNSRSPLIDWLLVSQEVEQTYDTYKRKKSYSEFHKNIYEYKIITLI